MTKARDALTRATKCANGAPVTTEIPPPVAVTLEKADGSIAVIARFMTIADAERFLAGPGIDQIALAAGDYGIDAPEEMVNPPRGAS